MLYQKLLQIIKKTIFPISQQWPANLVKVTNQIAYNNTFINLILSNLIDQFTIGMVEVMFSSFANINLRLNKTVMYTVISKFILLWFESSEFYSITSVIYIYSELHNAYFIHIWSATFHNILQGHKYSINLYCLLSACSNSLNTYILYCLYLPQSHYDTFN